MIDHERAMLLYLQLADVSRRKQQTGGRDKFLVLAGVEALRAGWPDVAELCRTAVVEDAPRHLLGQYETFADALRDADFQPFVRRMERFCPFEQAEALLEGLGLPTTHDFAENETAGKKARSLLEGK